MLVGKPLNNIVNEEAKNTVLDNNVIPGTIHHDQLHKELMSMVLELLMKHFGGYSAHLSYQEYRYCQCCLANQRHPGP